MTTTIGRRLLLSAQFSSSLFSHWYVVVIAVADFTEMHFVAFDQPLLKLMHSITKKMQTVVCMMHEIIVHRNLFCVIAMQF